MELTEILKCHDKNERRWDRLVKLYANSRIVPFIGAGMSCPVYPDWKKAIKNILNGSKMENDKVDDMLKKNLYEEACEYVKIAVGSNAFIERVHDEFSIDRIIKSREEDLAKVNSRYLLNVFNGPVFTTNFDKTIEYFYKYNFNNSYSLSNMNLSWASIFAAIKENKHNIYKLHGDIDDDNSWVFSKEEYENVYKKEEFVKVFETVCTNMNFLFMGCSLTGGDRYIKLLSGITKDLNHKIVGTRNFAFILLPNAGNKTLEQFNNEVEDRDRQLSQLGIFPIWYPCGKHEAIKELLSSLKCNNYPIKEFKGDETGKEKHFFLFSSRISVKDAFVDACFEVYNYLDLARSPMEPINLQKICELMEKKDLLYIEGDYGSGKTVLATRLQLELKKNYKTLYFDAETFFKDESIDRQLIRFEDRCFIFIDGIDKLIDIDLNLSDLDKFCERISEIIECNAQLSFVITSRMYCRIGAHKGDDLISMYVALVMQRDELTVIRTKGFVEKSNYEEFFSNINPNIGNANRLTAKTIKEWHKKSPSSCIVPLFAYAIGTFFYDNQRNKKYRDDAMGLLPDNKMIVYEDFVQKTIRGRFMEESLLGTINEDLYEKYETLLRNMAIRMIHQTRENINYQEDVSRTNDFSRQEAYEVNVNVFSEEIQRLLQEVILESRKKEVLLSDAINNYFFFIKESVSRNELKVRFSDLNVMCCFAADYIYDVIVKIADYQDKDINAAYDTVIEGLGMVELQPQVMDFLMCKIDALDDRVIDSLLSNILKFIQIYNQLQAVSEEVVRAVLLLYIVFIKFWRNSYKTTEAPNFFKTFYRLCMVAKALNINGKHIDGGHRYLVERYFMNCSFIEYSFKRLNYKYYNFSKSKIINSSFEQCNFRDNEFVETNIRNSSFKLCTIKTKFEKTIIDGIIEIANSILDEVIFEDIMERESGSTLNFRGCTILKMTISNTNNKMLNLFFENCIISDMKIRRSKGIAMTIKECVVKNLISIDANSEVYSGDDCFDRSVKSFGNLDENDYRKNIER